MKRGCSYEVMLEGRPIPVERFGNGRKLRALDTDDADRLGMTPPAEPFDAERLRMCLEHPDLYLRLRRGMW